MIWYETFIFIGLAVCLGFLWLIGNINAQPDSFEIKGDNTLSFKPVKELIPQETILSDLVVQEKKDELQKDAEDLKEGPRIVDIEFPESEPDLVYEDANGNQLYLDDLHAGRGAWVDYEAFYNTAIPVQAQNLIREAQILSKKSRYGDAMENLRDAAKLAPEWPYPYYERAKLFLKMANQASAFEAYKKTDALAPRGYYETKTAVHTLEREFQGRFYPRTFYEFQKLEALEKRDAKIAHAQNMVAKQEHFSAAWRVLANLYQAPDERKECIHKGLMGDYDADTYGSLMISKALIQNMEGEKQEAIKSLGELIFDPASTIGTMGMAKFALNSILK